MTRHLYGKDSHDLFGKVIVQILSDHLNHPEEIQFDASDERTHKLVEEHKVEYTFEGYKAYKRAIVFDIDPKLKKLFFETDPPKDLDNKLLRLPFDEIFLEFTITKEEYDIEDDQIRGLLLMNPKGTAISPGTPDEEYVNVWNGLMLSTSGSTTWINTTGWVIDKTKDTEHIVVLGNRTKQHELLRRFITNFLLFLHQPDVKTQEIYRTQPPTHRGGFPSITTKIRLIVSGETKRFIDDLDRQGYFHKHCDHRFWVRGHWRILDSEFYKIKKGQRIWIAPFVKGEHGEVVKKVYQIEQTAKENTTH